MPPKAAKEAITIDHARLALEIPSPVPPAPPAILMSLYGVKWEEDCKWEAYEQQSLTANISTDFI